MECHQSWRFVGRHFQLYDTSPRIPNWPWVWPCWNCTGSYKFSVSVKKMEEGWTGGAGDIVKAKSPGEDPRATGGLVSNLPHPRVNKTKQHTLKWVVSISRDDWLHFNIIWKSSLDFELWGEFGEWRDIFSEQIWSCDRRHFSEFFLLTHTATVTYIHSGITKIVTIWSFQIWWSCTILCSPFLILSKPRKYANYAQDRWIMLMICLTLFEYGPVTPTYKYIYMLYIFI